MKTTYLLLILPFIFISCSLEDDNLEPDNFYALDVGNSWVYNYYGKNQNTDEFSEFKVTDEVSVISTEEIRGNIYYKFRTETTHIVSNPGGVYPDEGVKFSFLRDSIGYLISSSGQILYTKNDTNELFLYNTSIQNGNGTDTIGIYGTLNVESSHISVEAGDFNCFDFGLHGKWNVSGQNLPLAGDYYFKNGVGFILKREGYLSGGHRYLEKRLNSFNIQ